ncbi:RagB/SusD family nutrient uptake outer membrane protein [Sphingobacterium sp. lm-10]|uniref:RagB/SusD family nutrient uptake outer membrane protein n=1 Tax=Sphingobacterium sp. lm-10 TaxID=2944904 RepID=UPI0020225019|nr:RagB/SusD family nutrient uptake outer membrane protein [Sphingobacterium sp. lm-10]MCL7987282.1 RagB/SusD family nutrient uptake outer membrane protein [Sphingobacterium sp. lm-10]
MKSILHKHIVSAAIGATFVLTTSCEKFVELGAPPTQVLSEEAFLTDASARSVILGLYVSGVGNVGTTTFYSGMAADDVQYNAADAGLLEFANNGLLNTNSYVNNLWGSLYQLVKNTNNSIIGLEKSASLTPAVKEQLLGEAKFMRAYTYLYLVNLYGDVPLHLLGDLEVFEQASLGRTSTDLVYAQIIADLIDAESKLPVAYEGTFRARVNKHAASALLARVYLYRNDWEKAELQATKVLQATEYGLPATTSNFTNTSSEVIFQIANLNGVTTFGANYITVANVIPVYTLRDAVYETFETTPAIDLRRTNWTVPKTVSNKVYYAISKYKVSAGTGNEYHIVLRLAEQYLIRAEARANRNNLAGAKEDTDAIRTRAGLGALPATLTQTQLLTAIETERLHEFFGEFGHRWFDLKRTGRATAVLSPVKADWQATDVLFPIPNAQILLNNNLAQNPGYEN